MKIHFKNGKPVNEILDTSPDQIYRKKWWLEYNFPDGCQFRGWINTDALSEDDFPETITGTFWACRDKETGQHGYFDLGLGEDGNWVLGSVYLPEFNIGEYEMPNPEVMERALRTLQPVKSFERFDTRIEDCLVPEKTYVIPVYFD